MSSVDLCFEVEMDRISDAATLSDVIARLETDPSLAATCRRDLISAVRCISEITGVDRRITPASLRHMRPLINAVRPARHGLSRKTWSNLCSNFRAALVRALPRQPRQSDPRWEELRSALPTRRFRSGLSREPRPENRGVVNLTQDGTPHERH